MGAVGQALPTECSRIPRLVLRSVHQASLSSGRVAELPRRTGSQSVTITEHSQHQYLIQPQPHAGPGRVPRRSTAPPTFTVRARPVGSSGTWVVFQLTGESFMFACAH